MARILVVDDSPLDRQIVSKLLEKNWNVELVFAEDGMLGLNAVDLHTPDLVLTDLQMPGMDGLELVSQIKIKHPLIPVILMTSAGSDEIAMKALKAGAATYVPKKRLAQDLWETVSHVLDVSREQQRWAKALLRMNRWEADFTAECDIDLVMTISAYLMQSFAAMSICDSSEQVRVGVALAEALLNAYYHGSLELPKNLRETARDQYVALAEKRAKQSPYKDRKIQISARFSRGHAIFSIRDEGNGFDPSTIPSALEGDGMNRDHGRGLLLMRTFMDEVKFNDRGNSVTMIKKASAKPEAPTTALRSKKIMAY